MNEKRKQLTLKIGEMSVLITMSSGCGVKSKKSKKTKMKIKKMIINSVLLYEFKGYHPINTICLVCISYLCFIFIKKKKKYMVNYF